MSTTYIGPYGFILPLPSSPLLTHTARNDPSILSPSSADAKLQHASSTKVPMAPESSGQFTGVDASGEPTFEKDGPVAISMDRVKPPLDAASACLQPDTKRHGQKHTQQLYTENVRDRVNDASHSAGTPQIPPKKWDEHREIISRLYVDEDLSLMELSKYMTEDYNFCATDRQYKRKIRDWSLEKKVKDHEMRAIHATYMERLMRENKNSIFVVRGRQVDKKKIERYAYRKRKQNPGFFLDNLRNARVYDLPSGVECRTPPNEEDQSFLDALSVEKTTSTQQLEQEQTGLPPRKRTKASARSRTGCWSCKARKVRCDEAKPRCAGCTKRDLDCDYSIRLNWGC